MSTELSRKLRRLSTPPERAMWRILYPFRQAGIHFRRQVQLGAYCVDFACLRPALIIEVDGNTHGTELAKSNDAVRDDYLRGRGFRILRFWNGDVVQNPAGVYDAISRELAGMSRRGAPPTPNPSPQGGGEYVQ